MNVDRLVNLNTGQSRLVWEFVSRVIELNIEAVMVNAWQIRSIIEASEVIEVKEESDTEQESPERLARNVLDEIDAKCDPVIDKVPEDSIKDLSVSRDEK